jgi:hypothetical protein
MSRVVHPDFQHGQRVEPYRRNFLRRTISRYQLVELFVIIGMILMVWGALSLGRVSTALKQAPSGWLDSVPSRSSTATRSGAGNRSIAWSASTRRSQATTPNASASAFCRHEPRNGFGNSSPAPNSTFTAFLAAVRAVPREPANAIMAGFAARSKSAGRTSARS